MPPIELFNLIPFYQRLPEHAAIGQVGPFQVALSTGYDAAVHLVNHPKEAGGDTPIPCFRVIAGCWAATGQVSLVGGTGEQSVHGTSPVADGGISDLLELLIFLTGRRVTMRENLERYHPAGGGDPCVHPMSVFQTAAVAWPNRTRLVERKMQLAIVYHNCATDYDVIPVRAGMYNTALNILLDNWPGIGVAAIPRPVRDELARKVAEAVDACPGLDDEQKGAYKGLLRSKVYQGTDSMHGRLLGLLQNLDIIDSSCDVATVRRVRHVNTAQLADPRRDDAAVQGPRPNAIERTDRGHRGVHCARDQPTGLMPDARHRSRLGHSR